MKTTKLTTKMVKELGTFEAVKFNKAGEIVSEAIISVLNDTDANIDMNGDVKTVKIDSIRRSWELKEVEQAEENTLEPVVPAPQEEVTTETTQETAEAKETAQDTDTPQVDETAQNEPSVKADEVNSEEQPITLTEATLSATSKGGDKFCFRYDFRGQVLEIVEYSGIVMQCNVYQEGTKIYKSPKLSVQDTLVNHFKLEGEELTAIKKAITISKKVAKRVEA